MLYNAFCGGLLFCLSGNGRGEKRANSETPEAAIGELRETEEERYVSIDRAGGESAKSGADGVQRKKFLKTANFVGLHKKIILILCVTPIVTAVLNYRNIDAASLALVAGALIFLAGIALLGEALLSVGYCAVLFAGAELMNSFGLEGPAKENRRCGNRLAGCVAAQTLCLVIAAGLAAWLRLVKGIRLFGNENTLGMALLFIVLIPLCLLAGLGTMASRVFAAARMGRTYRAVKELTE